MSMNGIVMDHVSACMRQISRVKILMTGAAMALVSSCAQPDYVDVQSSEIRHSSPEVLSLYDSQNEQLRREQRKDSFANKLLDGLLGSDPDDDYDFDDRQRGRSSRDREKFVSRNGDAIRGKLESKKQ